jgi:hypothetical protein
VIGSTLRNGGQRHGQAQGGSSSTATRYHAERSFLQIQSADLVKSRRSTAAGLMIGFSKDKGNPGDPVGKRVLDLVFLLNNINNYLRQEAKFKD